LGISLSFLEGILTILPIFYPLINKIGHPKIGAKHGKIGWRPLMFGCLLFGVFVEGVHDVVETHVYDLAVASDHRHA